MDISHDQVPRDLKAYKNMDRYSRETNNGLNQGIDLELASVHNGHRKTHPGVYTSEGSSLSSQSPEFEVRGQPVSKPFGYFSIDTSLYHQVLCLWV